MISIESVKKTGKPWSRGSRNEIEAAASAASRSRSGTSAGLGNADLRTTVTIDIQESAPSLDLSVNETELSLDYRESKEMEGWACFARSILTRRSRGQGSAVWVVTGQFRPAKDRRQTMTTSTISLIAQLHDGRSRPATPAMSVTVRSAPCRSESRTEADWGGLFRREANALPVSGFDMLVDCVHYIFVEFRLTIAEINELYAVRSGVDLDINGISRWGEAYSAVADVEAYL